jgi:hypothetical protein
VRFSGLLLLLAAMWTGVAHAQSLPEIRQNGLARQLIVDGAPYIIIGGELHNSSASSPAYMAPIWDKLARNHVRTVIGVASWELVEPQEGHYDFTAVDDQIRQARAHGMRLVLIWFGGYKNADSSYTPSWVRRDPARFPRVRRDPGIKPRGIVAYLGFNPTVSVFSEALRQADARAFAALMRHIKQVDRKRTVIMVQVENEVGLLGDSRDRSALAEAAWNQPVPSALLAYLRDHRAALRPELAALWKRGGLRDSGTWAEVFGTDKAADEVFMAWNFASYVEQVAKAGAAEYALPMYANAWLVPPGGSAEPGDYPSGGPVARMMDVWKAGAPTLSLLAPDIYVSDFAGVLANYKRADNPIFVPEARNDAANLFVALGQFDAIGFAPFGIEDMHEGGDLSQAYRVLNEMTGQIARAQATGRIRGFRVARGGSVKEALGDYTITIAGPMSTLGAMGAGTGAEARPVETGYGLVMATADDEFLVVGRGISVRFSSPGKLVEIDSAEEGTFDRGRWIPGRRMNGDERYALFPDDALRIVRIVMLQRPNSP